MSPGGQQAAKSNAQVEALLAGRAEARVIREYLLLLREHRPRPGRKRTPASVQARLDAVEAELSALNQESDDPLAVLRLIQERLDLTSELNAMRGADRLPELEARFIEMGGAYARRKKIGYSAWRELGVPAAVLRRAGITSD